MAINTKQELLNAVKNDSDLSISDCMSEIHFMYGESLLKYWIKSNAEYYGLVVLEPLSIKSEQSAKFISRNFNQYTGDIKQQ